MSMKESRTDRESREERERRAAEVAPAGVNAVVARMDLRIAWLEEQLRHVPAWQEELLKLKRMREAAGDE